jgi:hypothetical protein
MLAAQCGDASAGIAPETECAFFVVLTLRHAEIQRQFRKGVLQ